MRTKQRWLFFGISIATCFGVFVLPFLLPPPILPIVSAANVAGFNNKVAALSLACISLLVFLVSLREPQLAQAGSTLANGPMSKRSILLVCLCPVLLSAFLCFCVVTADARYVDFSYFIEQIQKHEDYARQLYTQIEFPYGPLIFYVPIWIKALLSPIGVSTRAAYIVSLLVEQFAGGLLLAWVLENMAITRVLKFRFFLICVIGWFFWGLGLNYTMFRFTAPLAILICAAQQNTVWRFAGATVVGEVLCLAISPEMGFAFLSATCAVAIYVGFTRDWFWWIGALAPLAGVAGFLAFAGQGYLRMLSLFASGVYNFIVEPTPYVLIFATAVDLIVPFSLARAFVLHSLSFRVLGAVYIFSLALLPVAFGRADPAHILYNGIGFYVLSMVAASTFNIMQQRIWLVCVCFASLFPLYVGYHVHGRLNRIFLHDAVLWEGDGLRRAELQMLEKLFPARATRIRSAFNEVESPDRIPHFDLGAIERITGSAVVATPVEVTNRVETTLKQSRHYVPLFYSFQTAILDRSAEEREVVELRQYQWILTPREIDILQSETPQSSAGPLGFDFPYPARRKPYIAGRLLLGELSTKWEVAAIVDGYTLYHKKSPAGL